MKEHEQSTRHPENIHPFETEESANLRIEQARRLKPLVRENGLKFEVFLPTNLGTWVLDMIEEGRFLDPSEAVFVMMGLAKDLDPHQDLKDELLKRELDRRVASMEAGRYFTIQEFKAHMEELKTKLKTRQEPTVWEKNPLE